MLTKGLNFGLNLHLHLYFVYASSEGSGESTQFAQTRLRLHCSTKRSLLVNICWSLYGHFYFKFKWRHSIHIQVQTHRANRIRNFKLTFTICVGVVVVFPDHTHLLFHSRYIGSKKPSVYSTITSMKGEQLRR